MHVVSAVVMHRGAALGAFKEVAGLGGNPAGGRVASRVRLGPDRERCQLAGPRGPSPPRGIRRKKVSPGGRSGRALRRRLGRPPMLSRSAVKARNGGIFGLPWQRRGFPRADLIILVSGQECRRVSRLPRTQQQTLGGGQYGLRGVGEQTGGNDGRRRQSASHESAARECQIGTERRPWIVDRITPTGRQVDRPRAVQVPARQADGRRR